MADPPEERKIRGPDGDAATRAGPGIAINRPATGSSALVPDWLINLAALGWRALAIAGLVLVFGFVGMLLWTITASIIVAIVISAVFAPLVLRLRSQGRSRTASAGIAWVAAIAVIVGMLLLLGIAFLPFVVELVTRVDAGMVELQGRLAELQVPAFVATVAHDVVGAVRSITADTDGGIVASAAGVVTIMILAVFLVFYFLRDGDKAWLWIFQAVSDQKRKRITEAGDDALARVGGYLRGTTVLSAVIALSDYVFMLVLGVPLALPLAVLVFFAGYIPYFGGFVTAAIILLVTLAALGPVPVLVMLVLFGIRDVILRYRVRPGVYGRTVSVHPAIVLIALLAGFELAGIVGLVAAVPVTAVILAVATAVAAIVDPDQRPQLPGPVPAWLDRMAQFSWRILVGFGLLALLIGIVTTVPLVVIPVVLATIVAATLEPLTEGLIARGQSRAMATAVAVGGGFFAVAAVLVLAMVALVDQAGEIGDIVTSGADSANTALGGHLELPAQAVGSGASTAVETIVALGQTFGALVVVAVVSVLLAFYFLRDGGRLWDQVVSHVRADVLADVRAAGSRAFSVLGGYMIGTAVISFVGAASQFVIMVVLGLPLALPVFVLSFFLSFIPYIGGFISTLVAFLIAVAVGTPADVVIMFIWTIVFNLVTGSIVAPIVYGKTVHIHPAIVLVSIPAGAAIAGILGMFIVVPALGVVAVTWRTVLSVVGTRATVAAPAPTPLATADVVEADST